MFAKYCRNYLYNEDCMLVRPQRLHCQGNPGMQMTGRLTPPSMVFVAQKSFWSGNDGTLRGSI
jgi:hypothetical protein